MRENKKCWVFPKYCGAVRFDEKVLTAVLPTHLAACLRNAEAWEVTVDGDRVTFTGSAMGPVCSFKWPVLAPFGCGELEIDSVTREVRYRLRVAHLIVFATVGVCAMAAIGLSGQFPKIIMILFLLIAWMWVVGGSLLIGVPTFTGFLRRSIASAPRTPAQEQK